MIFLPGGVAESDNWRPIVWSDIAVAFTGEHAPVLRPPQPTPEAAKRRVPAWSPVTLREGGRRALVDTLSIDAIVLDYDELPADPRMFLPDGPLLGPWNGYHRFLHTSYSHNTVRPKCRVIVLLAQPVAAADWPAVWEWAASRSEFRPDDACKDASRAYLVPAIQSDDAPWHSVEVPGQALVVPYADLPPPPPRLNAGANWTPTRPPPSEAVAEAHRHLLSSLRATVETIASLDHGRRTALQRAAYLFGGYLWALPEFRGDLLSGLREAAHRSGRWDDQIDDMLESTIDAGAEDPLPLDDVVEPALFRDPDSPPPIVQCGGSIYVLRANGREYRHCVTVAEAVVEIRDRREDDLVITTARGAERPWQAIARLYGTNANEVVYVYPRPDGTIPQLWNGDTLTAAITVAQAPIVEPEFDAEVQTWLRCGLSANAPEVRELVYDWLVTAWGPTLDTPSAALYLRGGPGTGKSMLAYAVASPWRSAPVPLGIALQKHNEPLLRCPVVVLDEGAGSAGGRAVNPDGFRDFLSSRAHKVEKKRGAVVEVRSAARVVICANNDLALDAPARATRHDVDAIAERVLHVVWAPQAKTAIMNMRAPDRPQPTAGWVTAADGGPGKIARHIAWMAQTRAVSPGVRWVVEGLPTAYHRNFLFRSAANRVVLDALCAALAPGRRTTAVRWEGGNIVVSVGALHAEWHLLAPEGSGRIARAALVEQIEGLAVSGHGNNWVVDGSIVRAYADQVAYDISAP